MRVDETVIGFDVYEDATEYVGIADVTLPKITSIVEEIQGAGINGKYESPILGQIEQMTTSFNFNVVTRHAISLLEPRRHSIDVRGAQQYQDPTQGKVGVMKVKHLMTIMPKELNLGKLATASKGDVSGEYNVMSYALYMDGKKMIEIDPLNYVYFVNGQDNRWEEIRKALGKQ